MAKEATLQKSIIEALRSRGAWVTKNHQTGRTARGVPDLTVCWQGRHISIEVKQPGQRPTALQLAQLHAIRNAGGVAIVATSVQDALDCLEHGNEAGQSLRPNAVTPLVAA